MSVENRKSTEQGEKYVSTPRLNLYNFTSSFD